MHTDHTSTHHRVFKCSPTIRVPTTPRSASSSSAASPTSSHPPLTTWRARRSAASPSTTKTCSPSARRRALRSCRAAIPSTPAASTFSLAQLSHRACQCRCPSCPRPSRRYQTHMIGKWHLGNVNESWCPWGRGFDSYVGYPTWAGMRVITITVPVAFVTGICAPSP